MRAWIFIGAALVPAVARGASMTEQQFQMGRDRLRQTQLQSDTLLQSLGQKLGVSPAFGEAPGAPAQTDNPRPPLFRVHTDLRTLQLASGKLLFGKTVNRLIIGGDGSPALLELDPGQGFLSNLRVMGNGRPSGTPGRVAIEINRLLLKTGKTVTIQAVILDPDGAYGLSAQVLSGKALAIGGAMASSFISGLAAGEQSQTANPFGFNQVQATGRNALLQGVAQTAADQSKRLIEEATAEKPILIIEPLTPVTVLIQEEVRL